MADSDSPISWDEYQYFDFPDMRPEDCQNSSMSVNLVDKNIFKNEFIGRFDMDWQAVYFTDKHMLEH